MWTQLLNTLLGVWLIFSPAVLHASPVVWSMNRVAGPLAAAIGLASCWAVLRPWRWFHLVLGVWLIVAPWILGFYGAAMFNSVATGVAMIALSFSGSRAKHGYGGGWRILWQRD